MSEGQEGSGGGGRKKYTLDPESRIKRVSVDDVRMFVGDEPVALTKDQVSRVESIDGVKLSEA